MLYNFFLVQEYYRLRKELMDSMLKEIRDFSPEIVMTDTFAVSFPLFFVLL